MSHGVDALKTVHSATPLDCPICNDPLFKVSEGRLPCSNPKTEDWHDLSFFLRGIIIEIELFRYSIAFLSHRIFQRRLKIKWIKINM
jgi:hypothetical protein